MLLMSVARQTAAQTETRPFVHNGYRRPYLIHRPAHLAAHPAVVFMLGGIRSTARFTSENYNWVSEADRNGFLVVFPEPVATQPDQPADRQTNITFWEMKGSRTHHLGNGALPVDDEGYLMAVLHEVIQHEHADRKRVFFLPVFRVDQEWSNCSHRVIQRYQWNRCGSDAPHGSTEEASPLRVRPLHSRR